jgi:hypothetical protein
MPNDDDEPLPAFLKAGYGSATSFRYAFVAPESDPWFPLVDPKFLPDG